MDLFYRQRGKPTSWCKACFDSSNRANYERNRDQRNRRIVLVRRARQVGMTPEEYLALADDPGRECAVCGAGPDDSRNGRYSNGSKHGRRNLAVDHSHTTGLLRGFLCQSCNQALGLAEDDPGLLRKMTIYLELGAPFPVLGSYERRPTRCSVEGCGDFVHAAGLCGKHYARRARKGTTADPEPRLCVVDGCGRKHYGRGLCRRHWWHWQQHGDPAHWTATAT